MYQKRYENAKKQMKEMHWNETDGIWYDYDIERKVRVKTTVLLLRCRSFFTVMISKTRIISVKKKVVNCYDS